MSKFVYPDERTLIRWVEDIKNPALFPPELLPEFDEFWFKEIMPFFELLKLPHYKDNLHHKAAHLFYKIAKDHRLSDGNKRSAIIALNLFFVLNGHVLTKAPKELYDLSIKIVNSKSSESEREIEKLESELQKISESVFDHLTSRSP